MDREFEHAFQLMKNSKSPTRAPMVGDLLLYESLLAGVAYNYAAGVRVACEDMPKPDAESIVEIERIRKLEDPSADDIELLQYFDVLERVRHIMASNEHNNRCEVKW
jgi:hypothetical protein